MLDFLIIIGSSTRAQQAKYPCPLFHALHIEKTTKNAEKRNERVTFVLADFIGPSTIRCFMIGRFRSSDSFITVHVSIILCNASSYVHIRWKRGWLGGLDLMVWGWTTYLKFVEPSQSADEASPEHSSPVRWGHMGCWWATFRIKGVRIEGTFPDGSSETDDNVRRSNPSNTWLWIIINHVIMTVWLRPQLSS